MKEELKKLAEIRINKAGKTINDAEILIKADSYFGSVNRSYYAAFYAARALLALKEMDSPKHSGVISLFNLNFIKTGIVEKEIGKILTELFESRSEGDYEDEKLFTREEADDILNKARRFVVEIKKVLCNLEEQ